MKYNKSRLAKAYKKQKPESDLVIAFRIILFLSVFFVLGFFILKNFKNNSPETPVAQEAETQSNIETVPAEEVVIAPSDPEELKLALNSYVNNLYPTYGISLLSTDGSLNIGINESETFIAASTIKVPVAVYIFDQIDKGNINPNAMITYTESDYEGGTGAIQGNSVGTRYSVERLLSLMISNSDNIALNMLLRTYGRTNIQNYLTNSGYQGINLVTNKVTPASMSKILVDLYNNKLLSTNSKNNLLGYMENSIVPERINNGVPAEVPVFHKIGTNGGAISDIAIIDYKNKPYTLSIYSSGVSDESQTNQEIKKISAIIYSFISKNY